MKRESLRQAVVRLIEKALLNGDLQPGGRIIESERDEISADHQTIIDALRAGDAVVAGEIVAQHVLTPAEEVVEQVRNWSKE